MERRIAVASTNKFFYFTKGSFRPSIKYPEYIFTDISNEENHIYDLVRQGLFMMGFDSSNYGKPEWNPLKKFVKPGYKVVIKPNLVMDHNPSGDGVECLYTQPSVVAPIVDYALKALNGSGEIIICDAPMQECDFSKLINQSGYDRLVKFYNQKKTGVKVRIDDMRELKSIVKNGVRIAEIQDGKGIIVDLCDDSEFPLNTSNHKRFRVTNYDPEIMFQHHNGTKNEYYINKNVLEADVIINMPKPKTHRKAGVTISMKNLVGINARKEFLPHHTLGDINNSGDEYLHKSYLKKIASCLLDKKNILSQRYHMYKLAMILSFLSSVVLKASKIFDRDKYYEGSWYGNDTISRTIVDLNKILFYANKQGILCKTKQRKNLIVADMIISGEKDGPVKPSAKKVGIIAIGEDPVCFDEAVTKLMGALTHKINTLYHARYPRGKYQITQSNSYPYIVSNNTKWNNKTLTELENNILYFEPTSGWKEAFVDRGKV